jgi:hypothetical protein
VALLNSLLWLPNNRLHEATIPAVWSRFLTILAEGTAAGERRNERFQRSRSSLAHRSCRLRSETTLSKASLGASCFWARRRKLRDCEELRDDPDSFPMLFREKLGVVLFQRDALRACPKQSISTTCKEMSSFFAFVQCFVQQKTGQTFSVLCTGILMNTLNKNVLLSLFDLAQLDVPASVQTVALHLGISRREAASSLNTLSESGLIRAETLRLTFFGLMKATGLRHRQESSRAA